MTAYERGSVVLVPFLFTDQQGIKRRPAVVVSSAQYHASRNEVIIAAVTGRLRSSLLVGDCTLTDWREAGLIKPSVATGILWTVNAATIVRRLGSLSEPDLERVDHSLADCLHL